MKWRELMTPGGTATRLWFGCSFYLFFIQPTEEKAEPGRGLLESALHSFELPASF